MKTKEACEQVGWKPATYYGQVVTYRNLQAIANGAPIVSSRRRGRPQKTQFNNNGSTHRTIEVESQNRAGKVFVFHGDPVEVAKLVRELEGAA